MWQENKGGGVMESAFEKIKERLEEELFLADREKERCARENQLQFDSAKGYANGIVVSLEIVNGIAEKHKEPTLTLKQLLEPNLARDKFIAEAIKDVEENVRFVDDICEWKHVNGFIRNPHTGRLFSNEPSMQNVYCNTCGKRIEVVEQ